MSILYQILIPTVVGALVGGLTNILAIKMLFHPFSAVYIGKWQLPFTPGLIPKRHDEIAAKLGKMVIEHLLTADVLKKKFQDPEMIRKLTQMVVGKAEQKAADAEPVMKIFVSESMTPSAKEKIRDDFCDTSQLLLDTFFSRHGGDPLSSFFSPAALAHLKGKLPDVSEGLLDDLQRYLQSDDGQRLAEQAIIDFISRQGFIGEMVLKIIGKNTVSSHFVPGVTDMLKSPVLKQGLTDWLRDELSRFWETPLRAMANPAERPASALPFLKKTIIPGIYDQLSGLTWAELPPAVRSRLRDHWLPLLTAWGAEYLAAHVTDLLGVLDLEQLVSNQVRTFSLSELENMIFSISKKELKMIARLGYLLGGVIGLIQGFLMLLF